VGSGAFAADHRDIVDGLQVLLNQDNGTGRVHIRNAGGLLDMPRALASWVAQLPAEIAQYLTTYRFPGYPLDGSSDQTPFICRGARVVGQALHVELVIVGDTELEQNRMILTVGGSAPRRYLQPVRTESGPLWMQVFGFLQMTLEVHEATLAWPRGNGAHVSSDFSHSAPLTHDRADTLPLSKPHSKSSQPRVSMPYLSSSRLLAPVLSEAF
jgi:hypothetical protein